jgi:hypothetical protein
LFGRGKIEMDNKEVKRQFPRFHEDVHNWMVSYIEGDEVPFPKNLCKKYQIFSECVDLFSN